MPEYRYMGDGISVEIVPHVTFEDWRSGLHAYETALQEGINEDRRNRILARRRVGTAVGIARRKGDITPLKPIDSPSLRESWRSFVGDIVTPELAIHRLLFCTFTFENFRDYGKNLDEVPGVQKGRKAIEYWMAITAEHTDSYVIVEERGKANSRLHYHGLVRVIRRPTGNDLLTATLRKAWSRGFSDVEEARSLATAADYVTKYVLKGQYEAQMGIWLKKSYRSHQMALVT